MHKLMKCNVKTVRVAILFINVAKIGTNICNVNNKVINTLS